MAYLTQITALCQTSHFLLDMQAASWDKQTPTDAHTKAGAESTQNLKVLPLPNTRKTNETFPLFLPQKEGRWREGEEILSDHNHMKLQEDLSCVENRNHNAERSRGGRGGKEKVTPEDIKSLWTVRVHVCESEEKLCVVEPGLEPKQTACKWRTGR